MAEHVARGRLKVHLGAAPGVGKTYAMLEEAHALAAEGRDVVVGLVEDHGRARTRALLDGLEILPRRRVEYRGGVFAEMDLPALLARAPEVAVVDELAHSNVDPEGAPKRWQDVRALLAAGIDVLTTVNIQHLESLNDVVQAITGTKQRETLPDQVLRDADEVELIDLTPDALRIRLAQGHVYRHDRVDAALSNYFRVGNLIALRELALLWLADQVEVGLARYRSEKRIAENWPARERIVVAVTGGAESETLIRRGSRIVGRIAGRELLAVHVVHDDGLVDADPTALAGQRALVESLGGTWHTIVGDDPAEALLDFARSVNASQLVLGVSRSSWLRGLLGPGVGVRVTQGAGDIDVHMVTHAAATTRRRPAPRRAALSLRRRITGWVTALLGPALVTAAFLLAERDPVSLSVAFLVYIFLVVVVALLGGLWPAVAAALLGTALINWFFTHPTHTLTIHEGENIVALVIFLAVAAAVAWVVDVAARRTTLAAQEGARASLLAELAAGVLRDGRSVQALLDQLRETFGQTAVTLVGPPQDTLDATGRSEDAPTVVLATAGPACASTPEADAVLVLDDEHRLLLRGRAISAPDQRILEAFAGRIIGVLRAQSLARERQRAEELAAGNAMRTALLAAVSHDLRSPLAGVKAAVSSLRMEDVTLDPADEAALLATIEESADRLDALVANLLDMSRVQAGALDAARQHLDPGEIIAQTLSGLGSTVAPGSVAVLVPPGTPAALGDAGLVERVLANLVENALRHGAGSPVTIAASSLGERVEIRVVDHGPGVPAAMKDSMFRPFQRLGDAPAGTGIGLGLAVAQGFTAVMGGELDAEDTPGGGLTMVLALRRAPAEARTLDSPDANARPESEGTP